jgi:hypothetical protein
MHFFFEKIQLSALWEKKSGIGQYVFSKVKTQWGTIKWR